MDDETKKQLESAGFTETSVANFLDLSPGEEMVVELQIRLAKELRTRREASGMTQSQLADAIGTSQARISAMENGEDSVSTDALIAALADLGADRQDIANTIAE